ncbi:uncharacterized protein LOC115447674 [Manduca sexta]|uniref:uncharacterized protein LOC115447674 n=1 Tax=Manduca sexta TaxID=7130 RepID=UPI0018904AA6|nr:uncharacterized protein LOC115447674 [Manduca sexta]
MGLQFEGATNNISEPQLAYIRNVLEKRGYKDTKVTFQAVGQDGDNFVASVKRIVVRNENGEFRMIAKIATQHELIRTNMELERLFRNEHIMYTSVLPKFHELEEQADLPKEDRLKFPECYGSSTAAPHEVILLEDLLVPGFIMLDKLKPLSVECIRSVLRNFALLHSLSYALKDKERDIFNEYKSTLYNMWGYAAIKPNMKTLLKPIENTLTTLVDGDHRKRLIKDSMDYGLKLGLKLWRQDKDSKHSVIQHGDSWTNNILFRFDGDLLQESVLIDYQISRVSLPIYDIMYMLFNCTDHKTRMEHFYDWIDYYHLELEKALGNYGIKANYVYSRDQLYADLKRYGKVIFAVSLILANSLVLNPEDAIRLKETLKKPMDDSEFSNFLPTDVETNLLIKRRVEGVVDSFVKLGLL